MALAETANGLLTGRYTGADTPQPVDYDDIVEAQQTDTFCAGITKRITRGQAKAFFHNDSHALCRRSSYGDQLVIPEALRERILTLEHHPTVAAHPGMNRMYYTMRRKYYWPSMITDIYNTITRCTTCAQNRLALRRHTSPLTLFPASEPLTDLSIDIFGPIPATKSGNRFILVITDRFSKLTKCVALRHITAISVASALIDAWVTSYGPPDRVLSEQGRQFMSNFFIAVMKMLGTETVRTTPYHPQTNGPVERYNRTMAAQLRHYIADDTTRWDEVLPIITMAYNSQPHRSTGIAPFELVIPRRIPNLSVRSLPPGTQLRKRRNTDDGSPLRRKREFMARLRRQLPAVVEALRKTQQRYKRDFDANVGSRNKDIRVGDYVYTTNHHRASKLESRAVGPFVVLDADASTFVIDLDGEQERVSSDHVTPAPRPSTADATPFALLDGLDKRPETTEVPDEYVIDRILGVRKINGAYHAKVRWFDYGPKEDTWEPLENILKNLVVRCLRQQKMHITGYSWKTPGHIGDTRKTQAPTRVACITPTEQWTPSLTAYVVRGDGVMWCRTEWVRGDRVCYEVVPLYLVRGTIPNGCRNICYCPEALTPYLPTLEVRYGPFSAIWPPLKGGADSPTGREQPLSHPSGGGNRLLLPSPEDVGQVVMDLCSSGQEATVLTPLWANQSWYDLAMGRCFECEVITTKPASWSVVAFQFLH